LFAAFCVLVPVCLSSCWNGKKVQDRSREVKTLEERVAALEKRQQELLSELKISKLRDKRFARSIKKLKDDKSYLEELESTLSKDVKQANERLRVLARVTNKLIDYTNRKSDELKSLKRKFYKLYRATMGKGKTFTEPATAVKQGKKTQAAPPTKESEKSRKLKKKVQEGMV